MSQNGENPVYYEGWHFTDVVRTKALARLEYLLSQDQPYYLQIAPYSPHVQNDVNQPIPLARHMNLFPDAKAPRLPNYNPPPTRSRPKRVAGLPGGKALFFSEDTNLPFAGFLRPNGLPSWTDSWSLLEQWKNPGGNTGDKPGGGNSKKTLNVEFWGSCTIEAPNGRELEAPFSNTTYKTLRILGENEPWLFTVWCNGDMEMYDTANDPYELYNLVGQAEYEQVLNRLNALLLETKSCAMGSCRDPWHIFTPTSNSSIPNATMASHAGDTVKLSSLKQAMNSKYDAYFASFPRVHFETRIQYQDIKNEAPFYPSYAAEALGSADRRPTDNFISSNPGVAFRDNNYYEYGTAAQRNATLEQIYANARNLTAEEIATTSKPKGRQAEKTAMKRWGFQSLPEWIQLGHD
ncbi:hypothetical protein LX32DRAFT_681668 [Colletotrichum zoysiae]|uniref:Sulfatase N-terminal domain-containing protein n=1 Tax=Colletotrichum zoysiae TaxID=1216348 RepID=A0AAD9HKK8_9PEZI|nr:hypothetical protein LX32DRAFT_681668 [Colletotrichum zoysiae]